jgi:predicted Zn-dependent protease
MNWSIVKVSTYAALVALGGCATDARIKTHPDPETRIESINKVIESLQKECRENKTNCKN